MDGEQLLQAGDQRHVLMLLLQGNRRSLVAVACMASDQSSVRTRKRNVYGQVVVDAAGHSLSMAFLLAAGEWRTEPGPDEAARPLCSDGMGAECRAAGGRLFTQPSRRPTDERLVSLFFLSG